MAFTNCTCSSPPNDPQLLRTEIDVIVCVRVCVARLTSLNCLACALRGALRLTVAGECHSQSVGLSVQASIHILVLEVHVLPL